MIVYIFTLGDHKGTGILEIHLKFTFNYEISLLGGFPDYCLRCLRFK